MTSWLRGSSVVEQLAVNELVVGSSPTPGAKQSFFLFEIKNRFKKIANHAIF